MQRLSFLPAILGLPRAVPSKMRKQPDGTHVGSIPDTSNPDALQSSLAPATVHSNFESKFFVPGFLHPPALEVSVIFKKDVGTGSTTAIVSRPCVGHEEDVNHLGWGPQDCRDSGPLRYKSPLVHPLRQHSRSAKNPVNPP